MTRETVSTKSSLGPSWVTSQVYSRLRATAWVALRHATKHTGVGIICSVAYFDPGNWGVDLQAGSEFGYKLLFVVLVSGLIAVYMQVLSSRLGCVTGLDLASHCRLLLHNRPKHKLLWRWLVLYPLYALSEIAIIATDLAELIGSGIALCLLFPKLPLWAGVLLTASDVLLLLTFRNPLAGKPVRLFEILIAALVFAVLICMAVIISKADVHWGDAFFGFVPSKAVVSSQGLYTSIGILGATVMPHSLFLGSAFATQERESLEPDKEVEDVLSEDVLSKVKSEDSDTDSTRAADMPRRWHLQPRMVANHVWRFIRDCFQVSQMEEDPNLPRSHADRENHTLAFVRRHLNHGIVDMVVSLLGIAVVINALILILASATFYYGFGQTGTESPATLFDAYDLLQSTLGKSVATLFALALLASGQSSSIIATLAGQTVSEGFIRWRITPVLRRLLTRCLGLIPSMAVAAALGRNGVSTLLVISQVVLSIVLPFIVFPLIYLTSSKSIMSVKKPLLTPAHLTGDELRVTNDVDAAVVSTADGNTVVDVEAVEDTVDFSNGKFMMWLGWVLWLLIVLANAYAIVTLAMGED